MKKKTVESEVLIVGAGFIGKVMALMLASLNISVFLVDKKKIKVNDNRTTAITQGSSRILKKIGIWNKIDESCEGIEKIFVANKNSEDYLVFDSSKLNEGDLGFIIENKIFKNMLDQEILKNTNINTDDNCEISTLKTENNTNNYQDKIYAESKKTRFITDLLIAADGRNSSIRDMAKFKFFAKKYNQCAYVFNITHEEKHKNIALERFFAEGPLALLPMKTEKNKKNINRSSVVWTLDSRLGDFTKLKKKEFFIEFSRRYEDFFGRLLSVSNPVVYPLNLIYTFNVAKNKIIFVGDSAQGIHPIAGQGFNLGLRDCETLCNLIFKFKSSGAKLNSPILFQKYCEQRFVDRNLFIQATDKLNQIFSNDVKPILLFREIGLNLINKSPLIKKQLMINAMGLKQNFLSLF